MRSMFLTSLALLCVVAVGASIVLGLTLKRERAAWAARDLSEDEARKRDEDHSARTQELQRKIEAGQAHAQALDNHKMALVKKLELAENALKPLQAKIEGLRDENQKISSQLTVANEEMHVLRVKIDKERADVEAQKRVAAQLTQQVTKLASELQKAQAAEQEGKKQADAVRAGLKEAKASIDSYQKIVDSKVAELKQTRQQAQTLSTQVKQLQTRNQTLEQRIRELESRLQQAEGRTETSTCSSATAPTTEGPK